jgi:predicted metal-dependent phosphoesterase TrpH
MSIKDLKKELSELYRYKIELHAHTSPVSGCSQIPPKEMVDTYKALGYDAIVITNHFLYKAERDKAEYLDFYLGGYEQTKALGKEIGLEVYLGAEIRFTENSNDYLIYGIDREMLSDIYDLLPDGVENFRKEYKMPNSVFLQAHPKRNGMQEVDAELLDGIEVFNMHPGHNSRVGVASLYAKENNFSIITAGSDFHHPNQNNEGIAAMLTACLPKDSFEIAELLKNGEYLLEVGRNNIIIP